MNRSHCLCCVFRVKKNFIWYFGEIFQERSIFSVNLLQIERTLKLSAGFSPAKNTFITTQQIQNMTQFLSSSTFSICKHTRNHLPIYSQIRWIQRDMDVTSFCVSMRTLSARVLILTARSCSFPLSAFAEQRFRNLSFLIQSVLKDPFGTLAVKSYVH